MLFLIKSFFLSCQKAGLNGTKMLRLRASSIKARHSGFWIKVELLPKRKREHLARVMATFNLLESFKNPIPPEAEGYRL